MLRAANASARQHVSVRLSKSDGLKLAALTGLFLLFSLLAREFIRQALLARGIPDDRAANLSAGAGLALLAVTVWPLFGQFGFSVRRFFRRPGHLPGTVLTGIACGVIFRLLDWLHLLTGDSVTSSPLQFSISCSKPAVDTVAVTAIAVPLAEEIVHRGMLLAAFAPFGWAIAVFAEATIFATLHTSYLSPFLFGVMASCAAIRSGSLWVPFIAHATFNLLKVLEGACLRIATSVPDADLIAPLPATLIAVPLLLILVALVYATGTGTQQCSDACRSISD